ncbi:MAG: ribbon-helix-helix domain-containing protein [Ignavibacteriales bacterium]|nr:ribbon-helix-helix domain-containing protein [Ignavibacteriales bacterium]
MENSITTNSKSRLNLVMPADLNEEMKTWADKLQVTISDIVRQAVCDYLRKLENDRIERELREGYIANYDYYKRESEAWKYADGIES